MTDPLKSWHTYARAKGRTLFRPSLPYREKQLSESLALRKWLTKAMKFSMRPAPGEDLGALADSILMNAQALSEDDRRRVAQRCAQLATMYQEVAELLEPTLRNDSDLDRVLEGIQDKEYGRKGARARVEELRARDNRIVKCAQQRRSRRPYSAQYNQSWLARVICDDLKEDYPELTPVKVRKVLRREQTK